MANYIHTIIGIMLIINVIFSAFLLTHLLYHQSKVESVTSRKCWNCTPWKLLYNLTYAAIGSFILCAFVFGIYHLYILALDVDASIIIHISGFLTWHIGEIFTYILLMLRVHYAFKDTEYATSRRVNITFFSLLCIYILCIAVFIIGSVVALLVLDNYSDEVYFIIPWAIGSEIGDLLITIFLICLFVKKMVLFAANMHNLFMEEPNELNQQQKGLLNVMTKYFLLSTIATLTTQVVIVLEFIGVFQSVFFHIDNEALGIANPFALILQLYTNNICLFLTFDVNDRLYTKLCKCCNKMVMVHFERITQKKVSEKNDELRVRLLTEGSNAAMIQEIVSMNNKIGLSNAPTNDDNNDVDVDDGLPQENATQYI